MKLSAAQTVEILNETAQSPWADPGPDGENLQVEDFPSFVLGHLASTLQREVASGYLGEFELTTPEWRTLAALATYTPIPFSELVKLSMSDKALVSRSAQSLSVRGLASVEADPDHGKRVVCRITVKGRTLYQRVLRQAQRVQAEILSLLDPAERVALHATLLKLRDALQQKLQA